MKYEISGMPVEGKELSMENYGTLLVLPWFQYLDIEQAKETCGFYRYLLDNAPIVGDKKRILVTARLQYLVPNSMSIQYADDWHVDGNITGEFEDRIHLFVSPATAMTQFNSAPITLEVDALDYLAINNQVSQNCEHMNKNAQTIKPNRFYTFDKSHVHRAVRPKQPEFRFMFRIVETDWFDGEQFFTNEESKYLIDKEGKVTSTWSIRRDENGIQVNPY